MGKKFLGTLLLALCAGLTLCAAHVPPDVIQVDMHVSKAEYGFSGTKSGLFSLVSQSGIAKRMKIEFETPRAKLSKELEVDTILNDPCGCQWIFSGETIQNGPSFFISLYDSTSCEYANHEPALWRVIIRSGIGWCAEEDSRLDLVGLPD